MKSTADNELSLPSQLLIRNLELIQGKNILVVSPPEPEPILELQVRRKTDVTVFTFDYAEYHQFTKAGLCW
jgi:hypothetical protein